MAGLQVTIVLGVLGAVGAIVALMVRSERKDRRAKRQIGQALGLAPAEPDPQFVRRLSQLYQGLRADGAGNDMDKYEFRNMSVGKLPEGEVFLFDLIDVSGGESSRTENQAVAIVSPRLNLPPFAIFPKADIEGTLPNLANKVLGWVVSKCGGPVEFSQVPEFGQRYLVSSRDPEAVRRFLDDGRFRRLANTRLLSIQAGGDIFTLSRVDTFAESATQESMRERVDQARTLLSIFAS